MVVPLQSYQSLSQSIVGVEVMSRLDDLHNHRAPPGPPQQPRPGCHVHVGRSMLRVSSTDCQLRDLAPPWKRGCNARGESQPIDSVIAASRNCQDFASCFTTTHANAGTTGPAAALFTYRYAT